MREEAAHVTPFGTLLHFKKDIDAEQPRVLLVAPLSGHFATLLRGTVQDHAARARRLHHRLAQHARRGAQPTAASASTNMSSTSIKFLEAIGEGAHVVAVCQPCVAALVAAAVMAQTGNPAQPRSMTLMAGPIDTRVNPTKVNELANSKPIDWFEQNLIARVPFRYGGAFRQVYPGFVQLAAFMSMNIERHVKAHRELYDNLRQGEREKAKLTKDFYDEYFAVLDLTAEFYLETVQRIFQEHRLATRHAEMARRDGRAARDPAHRAAHGRGREGRHLRGRPDARGARSVLEACGPTASATTCRPASATTACSAASAGKSRSIRW